MLRRNPYYIQDNIRLDLRDSKGRFSPPSRAKKFYLYVDDDLVRVGEFARVNDPVDEKEFIIADALSEIYEEVLEDIIDQEITPEEFEEPTPVPLEEAEEPEGEELAELLYEDLLREIAEVDPVFFQEITGELPPIKGKFSEKVKEFESWSLGDVGQPEVAVAQIFDFELDRGIKAETPEDMIAIIQSRMIPAIKQVYDERIDGLNLFLFNISFTKAIKQPDGSVIEVTEYISARRTEVTNWEEFEEDIIGDIYEKIQKNFSKYVARSLDGALKTVGFRFENLFETTTGVA